MSAVSHEMYATRLDEAARRACTAYLDGCAEHGMIRRFQEYDQLPDAGKAVWRAVVTRAVYDMLPMIKAFQDPVR